MLPMNFTKLLLQRIAKIKVENFLEDLSVSLSRLYRSAAPKRMLSLIDEAVVNGASLIFGDRAITGPKKPILQLHVVDNVKPSMSVFQEENSPFASLAPAQKKRPSTRPVTSNILSARVSFIRDVSRGMEMVLQIRAESCHVNSPTIYIEPSGPNGGVGGRSGHGRFRGIAGVEEFTERKIVSLVKPGMKYQAL